LHQQVENEFFRICLFKIDFSCHKT
jgi:hypothetical protein